MMVDVTETDSWPSEFDLEIGPSAVELDTEGYRLVGPVTAHGRIEKHAGWFVVQGRVDGDSQVDCSRCLEPVDRRLSFPFNIRLLRVDDVGANIERGVKKDDLDSSLLEGGQIDLNEIVREQILLEVPEQVLCKEDCLGLCPKCGANRNLIDCKCEDEDIDPRWAALRNLK